MLWELPHVSIGPEAVWGPVTNTMLCTWIAIIILFAIFFVGTRRLNMIPSGMQNAIEWVVEIFLNLVNGIAGKEKGRKIFPIVASFFFFIFVANMLDILPGIETIGLKHPGEGETLHPVWGVFLFGEESNKIVPFFRPPTTDLNMTLALAITSVVITQIFGFMQIGAGEHLSKYFNFRAVIQKGAVGLVDLIAGLFEIISEVGRIISFAFRLFGNIFAGSILLAVFAYLVPVAANVIFIPFEIFVGTVQAFVFSFLTLLFMEQASTAHGHHDDDHHGEGHATDAGHNVSVQ